MTIQSKAWVSEPRIYLEDIASINAPAHLSEKIASIYLTYAPKPGKSKFVKGSWIDSRIKAIPFYDQITLSIPDKVEIVRASQVISEEDYLNYYNDYIAKHIGPNVRFEISRFQVKGDTPLPVGRLTVNVQRQPSVDLRGYVSLTVSVLVNEQFVQRVALSGWVDRFEDIVCASRPLERNHLIAQRDVHLSTRNVSKIKDSYYTRTADVINRQIKRKAGNGEIIFSSMIEIPPLIYKGDKVTIIAESSSLLIKTTGIALSDGYANEQIQVRNTMSHKVIRAEVVDQNTVKVRY
ncbi:MAG: flagella basal body P-ring formation protein FlgA [Candidatus Magnetoglobus multicellularis str. Araruama]|uniref:Flagella basal body P-ring formation protein FlgA n=1 Tax=Candidatus Magnetoglobus multicellularis str. Araruama TaxID=890399 RepID=A0A1V1PGP5_9BACT|nr:MAG: flagella basal body P-ring formation protein FlgA [Candidatus Magnetoglobus multicellularis str. Araruama]